MESVFTTLKCELIGTMIYPSRRAAESEIFEYIEAFYNRVRLHSTLGNVSPCKYEQERAGKAA